MKSFKNLCLLFFLTVIILSACTNNAAVSADALNNIPGNVSTITAVDLPALMEKADFEKVKTMEFYQELIEEAKDYHPVLGEVAKDPARSGIDLDRKFYFVHDVDPQSVEEIFMAAVFSVKNAAQFESLVAAATNGNFKDMGAYKLYQKRSQTIAWNDQLAIVGHYSSYNDINARIANYFDENMSNTIANDEGLKKSFAEKHDINSWMNSNVIAENEQLQMILPLINIDPEALKDNTVHSYVDFNDGEVEGKSILKLNEGLAKDLDKLFKEEIETDFSGYVPGKNLNTLMTIALDVEGLKEVISARPQGKMYVDFALKEFGVTFDDITNTFGGDMIFSLAGKKDDPLGLFATNIRDENNLQKFLDLAVEYELLDKVSDSRYTSRGAPGGMPYSFGANSAHLLVHDGVLFASSNETVIETIETGGYSRSDRADKSLIKDLSNHVFGLFMDYDALAAMMEESQIDLSTLKLTTKHRTSEFNLKMDDKNTNSLKQLFEMANKQYLKDKNEKAGSEI